MSATDPTPAKHASFGVNSMGNPIRTKECADREPPAVPGAGDLAGRRFHDPTTGKLGPVHDSACAALSHDDEDSCSCGAMDEPDTGDLWVAECADCGPVTARHAAAHDAHHAGVPDTGDVEALAAAIVARYSSFDPITARGIAEALLPYLAEVRRATAEQVLTEYAELAESRERHMSLRRVARRRKESAGDGRERNVWNLVAHELRALIARGDGTP